jgi:hypothetical protein
MIAKLDAVVGTLLPMGDSMEEAYEDVRHRRAPGSASNLCLRASPG